MDLSLWKMGQKGFACLPGLGEGCRRPHGSLVGGQVEVSWAPWTWREVEVSWVLWIMGTGRGVLGPVDCGGRWRCPGACGGGAMTRCYSPCEGTFLSSGPCCKVFRK